MPPILWACASAEERFRTGPVLVEEELARRGRGALAGRRRWRPRRLVVRPHRSVPVPGRRLHVRRRVHDGRAPGARLAGARRSRTSSGTRSARRRSAATRGSSRTSRRSARAPRTTPGRRPAARARRQAARSEGPRPDTGAARGDGGTRIRMASTRRSRSPASVRAVRRPAGGRADGPRGPRLREREPDGRGDAVVDDEVTSRQALLAAMAEAGFREVVRA